MQFCEWLGVSCFDNDAWDAWEDIDTRKAMTAGINDYVKTSNKYELTMVLTWLKNMMGAFIQLWISSKDAKSVYLKKGKSIEAQMNPFRNVGPKKKEMPEMTKAQRDQYEDDQDLKVLEAFAGIKIVR